MNINKLKYLLPIFILLTSVNGIRAQIILQSYIEIGANNVSEGVFVKNVFRSSYHSNKYNFEAGMQFDLISNNPNTFTGLDIIASREMLIRDFPFDIKGFFMLNRFSDIMYETNWGVRIETRKLQHFLFELGTNLRTYTIHSAARVEYNIDKSNSKLNENFNLMYVISAYLKPYNNDWNVGLSCTNVDYYIINQSTNPVFNLQMTYKPKSNLTLYLDTWYKQSGVFNINANYFGYFFRGGVKWDI
jgi:hypothetical protein